MPVGGGRAWPGFEIDHSEPPGSRVAISRAGRRPPAHTAARPNKTGHAAAGNLSGQQATPDNESAKVQTHSAKTVVLGAFHPMGLHFGRNNAPDRDLIATNRGICTTPASDTPVTRRQQASCSANPHGQLIKDHCNAHNT